MPQLGRKDQKTPPSWKQLFTESVIVCCMIVYVDRRITWQWGWVRVQTSCTSITRREVALRLEWGEGLVSESGWEATAPCPTPGLVGLCWNTKAGPLHSELSLWAAFSLLGECPSAPFCHGAREIGGGRRVTSK